MTDFATINTDPRVVQWLTTMNNSAGRVSTAYGSAFSATSCVNSHHLGGVASVVVRTSRVVTALRDTSTARALLLIERQIVAGKVAPEYGVNGVQNLQKE